MRERSLIPPYDCVIQNWNFSYCRRIPMPVEKRALIENYIKAACCDMNHYGCERESWLSC